MAHNVLVSLFYLTLLSALVFAFIAIDKYPGKTAQYNEFMFSTDYWCDLYKRETPSGKLNPGMLFAKLATVLTVICSSCFWIIAGIKFRRSQGQMFLIICAGIAAISCALLLFSRWHDIGLIVGSISGAIAIGSLLIGLRHHGQINLFRIGLFVLILLTACNTVMYLPIVDHVLPLL